MVLSRRVAVLVAMVAMVVVALSIIGVLGAVGSASPNNDPNAKGRTLTVLTKSREAEVVDLETSGVTHGDMRAVNATLYNASGKERIGRFDLLCVVTDPADESSEKAHWAECMKTYTLPSGEISAQGVTDLPRLSTLPPGPNVQAVTGGTEEYAGVRGEVRMERRGTEVIHTFHFVD